MSNPIDNAIIEIILDHAGYGDLDRIDAKYDTILRLLWGDKYDQMRHEWFVDADITDWKAERYNDSLNADWSPK